MRPPRYALVRVNLRQAKSGFAGFATIKRQAAQSETQKCERTWLRDGGAAAKIGRTRIAKVPHLLNAPATIRLCPRKIERIKHHIV